MKKIFSALSLIIVFSFTLAQTTPVAPLGSGTEGNPYQITSLANLMWIPTNSANWDKYYIQTADIDASETAEWADGGWVPIGNVTNQFTGKYNGAGHTISSLYIKRDDSNLQGMFGFVFGGTIENLGLVDANIAGQYQVGMIAGQAGTGTQISNCFVTGYLNGVQQVGGITGVIAGSTSSIVNTYTHLYINGRYYVGGIAGTCDFSAEISECFSISKISNDLGFYLGGISGNLDHEAQIINSYSFCKLTGNSYIGGITGQNNNTSVIENCFSITKLNAQDHFGPIAGQNNSIVNASIFNGDDYGYLTTIGEPKTTAEMKNISTYTNELWDTENIWATDADINFGYPYLRWQSDDSVIDFTLDFFDEPEGSGTIESPFQIKNLDDLKWIASDIENLDKHYIQTENIDASATKNWPDGGWIPIGDGTKNFSGTYNGKGYKISRLFINREGESQQGLFGSIENATIDSLGLTNVNIMGAINTGGLAGSINTFSTVSNCYVTGFIQGETQTGGISGTVLHGSEVNQCYSVGIIKGRDFTGGITGFLYNGSTIKECFSIDSIRAFGSSNVGGITGRSYSNCYISDCYSFSKVLGSDYVGGITGNNNISSKIENCYAVGDLVGSNNKAQIAGLNEHSIITASFYNSDIYGTFGQTGTPKTTAEMKTLSTYTSASWDTDFTWAIDGSTNNGYPYLLWQDLVTGIDFDINMLDAPVGEGTEENPYQIVTLDDLLWINSNTLNLDKYYIQLNDIDASETFSSESIIWIPIGDSLNPFTGNYNGKGYKIDKLFIDNETNNYVGFFGYVEGGRIDSLNITNANVTGNKYVGRLAGILTSSSRIKLCSATGIVKGVKNIGGIAGASFQSSDIDESYSAGIIEGGDIVGGITGYNHYSGISDCFSIDSISAENGSDIGGLVGRNSNEAGINNSYSAGVLNGGHFVGGLAGENIVSSTILYCYSVSKVNALDHYEGLVGYNSFSDVIFSFFNTDITPWPSTAGEGKTSEEMRQASLYVDAGWPFAGGEWQISPNYNDGYPYLWFQDTNYVIVDVKNDNEKPAGFELSQNYPNPFNPVTTIKYSIPTIGARSIVPVRLKIFNLLGQEVATLVNEQQPAGNYQVQFNAGNLASGVYLYRLKAGDFTSVKKLLLLK